MLIALLSHVFTKGLDEDAALLRHAIDRIEATLTREVMLQPPSLAHHKPVLTHTHLLLL